MWETSQRFKVARCSTDELSPGCLAVTSFLRALRICRFTIRKLPTPASASLISGHLHLFSPLSKHKFEEKNSKQLGPIYRQRYLARQVVVVASPELQQEVRFANYLPPHTHPCPAPHTSLSSQRGLMVDIWLTSHAPAVKGLESTLLLPLLVFRPARLVRISHSACACRCGQQSVRGRLRSLIR